MKSIYITAIGSYLPNEPVSNDEMEDYLGTINGKTSNVRQRILKQNGIQSRHYALTKDQQSTHTNAQLAAKAAETAISRSGLRLNQVDFLATGTTQGDLPVPGFASMVHGELPMKACEIASFQSVCASGVMALKSAWNFLRAGEGNSAMAIGSEFASRLFKGSRFEAQQLESVPFDTEFLRWMLSDGAGAMVLEDRKNAKGLSLKIEWIELTSHAHEFPPCMYTGKNNNRNFEEQTWLDYDSYETASRAGAINLKQDIRLLDEVVKEGVAHYFRLIDDRKLDPGKIDWLCCHYSSEIFKAPIKTLMEKGGGTIPDEKWFSNLTTKGNTGSASIYIMLEELLYSGKLRPGQQILCMVPESGRFITSFMLLTVEGETAENARYAVRTVEAPELVVEQTPVSEWLVRQLTQIWVDFETRLLNVPIVQKIHDGKLTRDDYKLLLMDLRQQVIDGSQWISRAASNIDIDLFELRSAFIKHTAAEHKDYQLLEKNFMALGEPLEAITGRKKNIGSAALSAFMFQQASKSNPIDLLGAMFIIEGIGKRLAGYWGEMMKEQLGLSDDHVSFFTYRGVADENHFHNLEQALNHPALTQEVAECIAVTAKTTARLYELQLDELGNY